MICECRFCNIPPANTGVALDLHFLQVLGCHTDQVGGRRIPTSEMRLAIQSVSMTSFSLTRLLSIFDGEGVDPREDTIRNRLSME